MDKEKFCELLGYGECIGNCEQSVTSIFAATALSKGLKMEHDVLGNTYACFRSKDTARRILIEAHCDEIGFQVIHIADSGYVYIRR